MSMFDFNQPPEEDQNEPKPDTNKQPSFAPKCVIHRSKPLYHSGDSNRWPASIFKRKPASPPEARNQPEVTAAAQPETLTGIVKPEAIPTRGDQTVPQYTDKRINPGLRLRALVTAGKNAPPLKPQSESRLFTSRERTRRAYWDVTAGFSLIVNAKLVGVLMIMAIQINNLKTTVNDLLSGLYGNFVEMGKASITTTITMDTQVPIDFMLPIQQNTDVILTHNVAIPNAHVVINSGGFTVNAPATVTLPAGTNLPIALNMAVPVQATVPITLQVPVNIPLNQTQLHTPFAGLQNTIHPFYCSFDKNAQYPQGIYICIDHDVPTPSPGVP
ncbi:MAG TPA: hypothetical protein VII97_14365 [Anaerolineales bacterium]